MHLYYGSQQASQGLAGMRRDSVNHRDRVLVKLQAVSRVDKVATTHCDRIPLHVSHRATCLDVGVSSHWSVSQMIIGC